MAHGMAANAPAAGAAETGGWVDPDWIVVVGLGESGLDNFICLVCHMIMNQPTSGCGEGHACCRKCYETWLQRNNPKCPKCRAAVARNQLTFSRPLANVIDELTARCKHADDGQAGSTDAKTSCTWEGKVSELAGHLKSCEWGITIQCPFAGCGKEVPMPLLEDHTRDQHDGQSAVRVMGQRMQSLQTEMQAVTEAMKVMLDQLAEAGGVDAVVKAMQTHLQHAGVQEQGCGALMNLAAKDALRASIKDLGGCTAARSASEAHGLSLARELAEMLA